MTLSTQSTVRRVVTETPINKPFPLNCVFFISRWYNPSNRIIFFSTPTSSSMFLVAILPSGLCNFQPMLKLRRIEGRCSSASLGSTTNFSRNKLIHHFLICFPNPLPKFFFAYLPHSHFSLIGTTSLLLCCQRS